MKILHENGKLFGKISMVDILVFVLAIMLIYSIYNRYNNTIIPKTNDSSDKQAIQKFYFDMRIDSVIPETVNAIKEDDIVYDKLSGTEIGKVKEIIASDSKVDFQTKDGKIVQNELKEKVDIVIKVESNGYINDGKYLANKTINILAGETRQFETKYVSLYSKVLNVYKVEE